MKATQQLQLTLTQRFVLDHHFHSYPDGMSFEAILNGYENESNDEIVATDFWSNNMLPCELVAKLREMEVELRGDFFPKIRGDSDLMLKISPLSYWKTFSVIVIFPTFSYPESH